MYAVTWFTRSSAVGLAAIYQLLLCALTALLTGGAIIWIFAPQREVAVHLLNVVRELRKPVAR
jgi:hypothetical protein